METNTPQPTEYFDILSPDGYSISMREIYTKDAVENALNQFVERYRMQGYYSTSNRDRLSLGEIKGHCRVVPMVIDEDMQEMIDNGNFTIVIE